MAKGVIRHPTYTTHTIPGDEQHLIMSGSDSRLYSIYNPPMEFLSSSNSGYDIALHRLEMFYSFPNINSSNNSIRISIDSGKNRLDLKIQIGCYDINAINEALQRLLPDKSNDGKIKDTIHLRSFYHQMLLATR